MILQALLLLLIIIKTLRLHYVCNVRQKNEEDVYKLRLLFHVFEMRLKLNLPIILIPYLVEKKYLFSCGEEHAPLHFTVLKIWLGQLCIKV